MCRPEGEILLQRVGIEIVDEELELLGLPRPSCPLCGPQPDPTELLGRHLVVIVVISDQPVIAALGVVQPAGGSIQFGDDPTGEQLAAVASNRLFGPAARIFDFPAGKGDCGLLGQHVGAAAGAAAKAFSAASSLPWAARQRASPTAAAAFLPASGP